MKQLFNVRRLSQQLSAPVLDLFVGVHFSSPSAIWWGRWWPSESDVLWIIIACECDTLCVSLNGFLASSSPSSTVKTNAGRRGERSIWEDGRTLDEDGPESRHPSSVPEKAEAVHAASLSSLLRDDIQWPNYPHIILACRGVQGEESGQSVLTFGGWIWRDTHALNRCTACSTQELGILLLTLGVGMRRLPSAVLPSCNWNTRICCVLHSDRLYTNITLQGRQMTLWTEVLSLTKGREPTLFAITVEAS